MAKRFFAHLQEIEAYLARGNPLGALFDFDGTLAPIKRWPKEAQISSLTGSLLHRLSGLRGVYLGIISGRRSSDLYKRVGISGIYYGGCHGLEIEGPGLSFQHPEVAKTRPHLRQISRELRAESGTIKGAMVEDKGLSVSLHYRNVRRESVLSLQEIFYGALERHGDLIEVVPGKEVLEVRPRLSWNKGNSVILILDHIGKREGRRPLGLYVGDDQTDEDAFTAIGGKGLSICVGSDRHTAARYFLHDIKEVQRLLRWMIGFFSQ